MKPVRLVLSCEHAVNTVPAPYQSFFEKDKDILNTHRGLDIGAYAVAKHLHQVFECDFTSASVTRLLVDCNRSVNHPRHFYINQLSREEKQLILNQYYYPYIQGLENIIEKHINKGYQVLHVSVHSFTPVLNQIKRNAAFGVLYDSLRHAEKEVARIWQELLTLQAPHYRVRLNYPYKGRSDSVTRYLRKRHGEKEYLGLEIECNQALLMDEASIQQVSLIIAASLTALFQTI